MNPSTEMNIGTCHCPIMIDCCVISRHTWATATRLKIIEMTKKYFCTAEWYHFMFIWKKPTISRSLVVA